MLSFLHHRSISVCFGFQIWLSRRLLPRCRPQAIDVSDPGLAVELSSQYLLIWGHMWILWASEGFNAKYSTAFRKDFAKWANPMLRTVWNGGGTVVERWGTVVARWWNGGAL